MQPLLDTNDEYLVNCAIEQIPEDLTEISSVLVEFPLPELSLLSALAAWNKSGKYYWRSRDEQREYAGFGVALEFSARFESEKEACLLSLENLITNHEQAHLITTFLASSFSSQESAKTRTDSTWSAYPHLFAVVPQVCLLRQAQRYSAVVCLNVSSSDNKAKLVRRACRILEKVLSKSVEPQPINVECESITNSPSAESWSEKCKRALEWIHSGELDKLVLARRVELELSARVSATDLAFKLQESLGQGYSFIFSPSSSTAFVCQSPENLFSFDGVELSTEALGGSALETLDSESSASAKLHREHAFVVDDLQNKIDLLSSSNLKRLETEVVKLPYISHLRTRLSTSVDRGINALNLIWKLHPTPAVGVSPSAVGVSKIIELEDCSRGWYSAPCGVLRQDCTEFAVALRGVLLKERKALIFGGAGIVEGSDPREEWEEVEGKLAPLLSVFKAN